MPKPEKWHVPDDLVIPIDGLSVSGKGSARHMVAQLLSTTQHVHEVDSGVFYRAGGVVCNQLGITDERKCAEVVAQLDIRMRGRNVWISGDDLTDLIRDEEVGGRLAAWVGKMRPVRDAVNKKILAMPRPMVVDGRDMCHVFDSPFRFVLTASLDVRVARRVKELQAFGKNPNPDVIREHIIARDWADIGRKESPYLPHPDSEPQIDTGGKTVYEVALEILGRYKTTCTRLYGPIPSTPRKKVKRRKSSRRRAE